MWHLPSLEFRRNAMLRTIDTDQLRAGMYVHKLLGPWLKHPFWRTSFLAGEEEVTLLRNSAVEQLVVDTVRGIDPDFSQARAAPAPEPRETACPQAGRPTAVEADAATRLESELVRARRICLDGRQAVEAMFAELRMGRSIDPESAMPIIEEITGSVMRHPSALVSVARLKTADDYTYLHSVATSALMSMLARQLGLPPEQIMEAAMGGLLHDMGKARMPLDVLNKAGKLTDDEYSVMKHHPAEGERLLREGGVDNAAVLDIALHHHEKIDGSGYPHQLAGEGISLLSRMGAVCDVYDAITSNRPYKQAWDPGESLRRMASWSGHFDPRILKAFIKSLGIYPTGTLVRLSSEKLAVVLEQNPVSLLTPRVRAFYSAKSRSHILLHDIDLSQAGCNERLASI
jgi:putative nucleotidyltransferase with HDIG domain